MNVKIGRKILSVNNKVSYRRETHTSYLINSFEFYPTAEDLLKENNRLALEYFLGKYRDRLVRKKK